MEQGKPVPNEILIGLLQQKIGEPDCVGKGWLLDGFPRTGAQAEAMLRAGIAADAFVVLGGFEKEPSCLVERCAQRRLDPATGRVYNLTSSLPEQEEAKERLISGDDTEERIKMRIKAFEEHTAAITGSFASIRKDVDAAHAQGPRSGGGLAFG